MLLFAQAQFRDLLAMPAERLLELMALLLEPSQFGVVFLQRLARLDHLPVDQQALVEIRLAFGFQAGQRIVA